MFLEAVEHFRMNTIMRGLSTVYGFVAHGSLRVGISHPVMCKSKCQRCDTTAALHARVRCRDTRDRRADPESICTGFPDRGACGNGDRFAGMTALPLDHRRP